MDGMLLVLALGLVLGPLLLVVEGGLALWRPTRYFAIPFFAGVIAGALAVALTPGASSTHFFFGFTLVALPIGLVCAAVGIIAAIERAGQGARRRMPLVLKLLLWGGGVIALVTIADRLDAPSGGATRMAGTVHNKSVSRRQDGTTRDILDVQLTDGRRVDVHACPALSFDARELIDGVQVAVDERRRRLSGRSVYELGRPQLRKLSTAHAARGETHVSRTHFVW